MSVVSEVMVRNDLIDEMERKLSHAASIPVVGTLAGLSKALVGVAMVVSGLAAVIFIGLSAAMFCNLNPLKQSVEFVKRGFKNIGRGLEEAIPGHGAALWQQRLKHEQDNHFLDAKIELEVTKRKLDKAVQKAQQEGKLDKVRALRGELGELGEQFVQLQQKANKAGIRLPNFK